MQITREMIIGARVVQVHQISSLKEGLDMREHYFTCDRGFSFCLPSGGFEWFTEPVPPGAEPMQDEVSIFSYMVKRGWFGMKKLVRGSDSVDNTISRLKQPHIAQVLCGPFEEEFGVYEDTTLLMSDGYRLSCTPVAPHGTGAAGLYYHPPAPADVARLTDYFTIPIASRE